MSELVKTNTAWLTALQAKQRQAFLARKIPTRHEEQWKYTDLHHVQDELTASLVDTNEDVSFYVKNTYSCENKLVFINGRFSPKHSNTTSDIIVCSIKNALEHHEELVKPYLCKEYDAVQYPFVALNTANFYDGMFLYIPKKTIQKSAIHCVFVTTAGSVHPRNIIVADNQSEVTVIEEYIGVSENKYLTNSVTQIYLHQQAKLHFYKIQNESSKATHIANIMVDQQQDTVFKSFNLAMGSLLAREDLYVDSKEQGASSDLYGLYLLAADGQHIDQHLYVNHFAPHGNSKMFYKGILEKKSRAVFNGRVFVEKNAQKINAEQANHNLLLSQQAEIYTKPELEIYADDVKCAHGATVGQIDQDAMFYLQSRGIPEAAAKKLLVHAFADELVSQIQHPEIMQYIQKRVDEHEKL